MVYYTGDIHGSKYEVVKFCKRMNLTAADIVVILGDVGANYSLDESDRELKAAFSHLKPTIFCVHGNHEIRPANIPTYITMEWNGGTVWYEDEFPNILFAKDGDIYEGNKMAASDYRLCDVCDGKAFYDSNLYYESGTTKTKKPYRIAGKQHYPTAGGRAAHIYYRAVTATLFGWHTDRSFEVVGTERCDVVE